MAAVSAGRSRLRVGGKAFDALGSSLSTAYCLPFAIVPFSSRHAAFAASKRDRVAAGR
jgi:hypothetical protein